LEISGTTGKIRTPEKRFSFTSALIGRYNLENILSAVGAAVALKIPARTIQAGIETFGGVPGRVESVPNDHERFVFVDYAHTPDALASVLATLRKTTGSASGKLICVFGCGGDRDRGKRPQMGAIARKFCDMAIITSDNPRTESPTQIIDHILNGMQTSTLHCYTPQNLHQGIKQKGYLVEIERGKAIELAVRASAAGDIILIAGKGHEDYQIIGKNKMPFDDRMKAKKALAAITV